MCATSGEAVNRWNKVLNAYNKYFIDYSIKEA